jgi:hypothetical protein
VLRQNACSGTQAHSMVRASRGRWLLANENG